MPEARHCPECHAIENEIFIFGGRSTDGKPTNTTWKCSTDSHVWTVLADAPMDHNHVMVQSGKGEETCFLSAPTGRQAGELKYHVATDTWTKGGAGLPGLTQGHTYGCGVCTAYF